MIFLDAKHNRITAIHYEGDVKMNVAGSHKDHRKFNIDVCKLTNCNLKINFPGNGRVTLDKNLYYHWKAADWTNSHGMNRFFTMDHDGILTINDHGLFMIYAQVSFSSPVKEQ